MTDYKIGILMILMTSVITIAMRVGPIFIFSKGKKVPKYVLYLGEVVPYAAMGLLIIYCLKDVKVLSMPYAIKEIISIIIVVMTYLWKRNSILSVVIGTLIYMYLVQVVLV